ncbi:MAG: hypothetical protein OEZ58_23590 [Gammaproteobacteria bacterium]|nr:hypothetical protein [Gammaproteobacteria bacterium]MDH5731978.1 hypothetical protein [Gammaproteobacteria bacterium]
MQLTANAKTNVVDGKDLAHTLSEEVESHPVNKISKAIPTYSYKGVFGTRFERNLLSEIDNWLKAKCGLSPQIIQSIVITRPKGVKDKTRNTDLQTKTHVWIYPNNLAILIYEREGSDKSWAGYEGKNQEVMMGILSLAEKYVHKFQRENKQA